MNHQQINKVLTLIVAILIVAVSYMAAKNKFGPVVVDTAQNNTPEQSSTVSNTNYSQTKSVSDPSGPFVYYDAAYKYELTTPKGSVLQPIKAGQDSGYIRIQNYDAKVDKNGLTGSQFFLETDNSEKEIDCEKEIKKPTITMSADGTALYTGPVVNEVSGAGESKYALCANRKGLSYLIIITAVDDGSIAGGIFRSFKFTN